MRWAWVVLAGALLLAGGLWASSCGGSSGASPSAPRDVSIGGPRLDTGASAPLTTGGTAAMPLAVALDAPAASDAVRMDWGKAPRAALLFDLDTGRVLYRRAATRVLPIASLTKMMTALVVVDHLRPHDRVPVSRRGLRYSGSALGMLPKKRKSIQAEALLNALLLISANDVAHALAREIGDGDERRFVREMNRRARSLGMTCTRFTSPDGFVDRGNHSCTADLAALTRAFLRVPRLARIVRRKRAIVPFPTKGGRVFLYTTNPLLRTGYRGATGLKTGFTDAAGRCLVATARRGNVRLGVVLLHSPDPGRQARALLNRGFAALADER